MNFANVKEWSITEGDVLQVTDSQNRIIWKKDTGPDYTEPFYVENISNSTETLSISKWYSGDGITIQYSTNKSNWYTLGTTSTTPLTRTLAPGGKIYLRCNTGTWYENSIKGTSKIGGNIMSLLYGSSFTGQETSIPNDSWLAFSEVFESNQNLIDAASLLLPATRLTLACYKEMFALCENLVSAPALPATTLADGCYQNMFDGCTSLTTAPVLPATTLVEGCYVMMFGASGVKYVKCLATSGINTNNTSYWLNGVPSTGTFVKAAGVTWPTGVSGIPSGWTIQEV